MILNDEICMYIRPTLVTLGDSTLGIVGGSWSRILLSTWLVLDLQYKSVKIYHLAY